jgi:hypothetical protein
MIPVLKKKRLVVEVLGVARMDECPLTIHVELGASQFQFSSGHLHLVAH